MAQAISLAIVGWMGGPAAVGGAMGVGLIEIGVGLALSGLSRLLLGQQNQQSFTGPGIRTEVPLEGESTPQTMILGRYATAGFVVAPYYATGRISISDTDVDDAFRWQIYSLADYPITSVPVIWINGIRFDNPDDFTGDIMTGFRHANPTTKAPWAEDTDTLGVQVKDGTQTVAENILVNQFGSRSKRPWTNSFIGTGIAYSFLMFRYDSELHKGEPRVLFEVNGAKLYDRRNDSTNGGTGTQREGWANRATHAYTENPVVMIENIMHGIELPDGTKWGLGVDWTDLPANIWNAAKAVCDQTVNGAARYRAGIEIKMATADAGGDDPFDIVDELLKACNGSIVDIGGVFHIRCGPPDLPVATISDDNIKADQPQDVIHHQGSRNVYNCIRATFPNPAQQWRSTESPIRRNSSWIAEDGEELFADVNYRAVPYRKQVQQLNAEFIKDSRRLRAHTIVLPKEFSWLLPLNVISWNSSIHGYVTKSFEITERALDPFTLDITLSIREVDPNDYNPEVIGTLTDPDDEAATGTKVPFPYTAIVAYTVKDEKNDSRRPAIRATWPTTLTGLKWVTWEVKPNGDTSEQADGTWTDAKRGKGVIPPGVLVPNRNHKVRLKGNNTLWSDWVTVKTAKLRFGRHDLENGAAGGRKRKAYTFANDWPLWDLEDDIENPDDDDPSFEVTGGTSSYTWLAGGNAQGAGSLRITRDGSSYARVAMWPEDAVPLRSTAKEYYFEAIFKTESGSSTGTVHPQVVWLDSDRVTISVTNLSPNGNGNLLADTTYRVYSDRIRPPAGARFALGRITVDDGGPSILRVDSMMFRKANADDLISDGKINKRHAKKEDWTKQRTYYAAGPIATPPTGSRRTLATVPYDGPDSETGYDIELHLVATPGSQVVNGETSFRSVNFIEIWAGNTRLAVWGWHFKKDDSNSDSRMFEFRDKTARTSTPTYYAKVYRDRDGPKVNYYKVHMRVGQKVR